MMVRAVYALSLVLLMSETCFAQIGKTVSVAAGSPEDKALTPVYAAPDGPEKVALLDKFVADYGKGDYELLADELYVQTYLAQKNYDKVYEYGEKALALDPESLAVVVNLVHAADEQDDTGKLFAYGEKAAEIVKNYQASPAPAGISAEDWTAHKAQSVQSAQSDLTYVQYSMVNAAYKVKDPAARAGYFERFAAAFPNSSYTSAIRQQTAIAYEQAQNKPKMLETAQSILKSDPDNVAIRIMLADYWSDNGQQLDQAAADAQKALDFLAKAQKPENVSDPDWQQQVAVQKGMAYTSLGQVNAINNKYLQAVGQFKLASPLLKSNNFAYGRNLYRLGFSLAKLNRTLEARTVLTECVSVDSPYKPLAQQTLAKIGGPVGKTVSHKSQ
jgi:tetratricopeptide (TPR) repeat protein